METPTPVLIIGLTRWYGHLVGDENGGRYA